jgi:hypothetical protein
VLADRPRRAKQLRLRRPATWSLSIGAASLVPLSANAFLPPARRLVTWGTPHSGGAFEIGGLLYVVAGCIACVWLVRLQWLLARAQRISTMSTDAGLWLMWAIPIVSWIVPAVRISRWDKAIHGRRSVVVLAWAALWVPFSALVHQTSSDETTPDASHAWRFTALAVVTLCLWAATVVRLTRGAEVLAHETGVDA